MDIAIVFHFFTLPVKDPSDKENNIRNAIFFLFYLPVTMESGDTSANLPFPLVNANE